MALLFPLTSAGAVDDPEFGHFEADPDHGGFDFPDDLSDRLHGLHHRGRPAWETETERAERIHTTDLARRRDPAALYDAVGHFSDTLERFAGGQSRDAEVEDLKRQIAELKAAQEQAPADAKTPARARTAKT